MLNSDVNRREFLKITAGAGAALAVPTSGHSAASYKMIGIQVGAVSFVDEGTERVLDVLQERACVNTLFLAVFTYGRGIVRLGESVCATPEEFKAWSQNLGHEKVRTTFLNYGEVECHRQGEIIGKLMASGGADAVEEGAK